MALFKKKLKPAPTELDLEFEGRVKRIQFNPGGGFKMTVDENGTLREWWVPNDPGNRHCQFIRQWMCDGGFPEDPDLVPTTKTFGLHPSTWQRIGAIILILAAAVTAAATVISVLE